MKKVLSLILFFSLLILTTSCMQNNDPKTTNNDSSHIQTDALTENIDESLKNSLINAVGGGIPTLTKYRSAYCDIPRPFANLVNIYEFQEWYENVIKDDPNETNVMVMKLFIQEFNIAREDFDKANLEWAKIIINGFHGTPLMNPQDYANQETDEVYNADVIYTFDDETINNYYLSHDYPFVYISDYENALEAGTYETRTTDWVDIEQMEAEIIAKYGEAEIETTLTEETAAPDESTEAVEISAENFTDNPTDTH